MPIVVYCIFSMTTWPPDYGPRLPLWDAVYKQNGALVTNILASVDGRTQVNVAHGMWRQTCVHLAVQKGNLKILKMLLFVNADANARMVYTIDTYYMYVFNLCLHSCCRLMVRLHYIWQYRQNEKIC